MNTQIQYIFLTHPLLFGLLFGILGTIRQQKDHEVSQLIEELRHTASHLRTHCRPYDLPARWGGEEFILLLPDTSENIAMQFTERAGQALYNGKATGRNRVVLWSSLATR